MWSHARSPKTRSGIVFGFWQTANKNTVKNVFDHIVNVRFDFAVFIPALWIKHFVFIAPVFALYAAGFANVTDRNVTF